MTLRSTSRAGPGLKAANEWQPPMGNGYREAGLAALRAVLISLPIGGIGGWRVYSDYARAEVARIAFQERLKAHDRLIAAAPQDATHGFCIETSFRETTLRELLTAGSTPTRQTAPGTDSADPVARRHAYRRKAV